MVEISKLIFESIEVVILEENDCLRLSVYWQMRSILFSLGLNLFQ